MNELKVVTDDQIKADIMAQQEVSRINREAMKQIEPAVRVRLQHEVKRLAEKHPRWNTDKLVRKAGEKFNIKFSFE